MRNVFNPFRFVVIGVAGWMNQKQQHAIDYLAKRTESSENSLVPAGCGLQMINVAA